MRQYHSRSTASRSFAVIVSFAIPLFMTVGCGIMPCTVQPVKGVTQVGTSSEALAQCEAEVPASTFQEQLDRLNQSAKTFGNVGNKAGSASDALTRSESDTGARVGKDIGEVAGFFMGTMAIAKEEEAREKALNACLKKRGFELG